MVEDFWNWNFSQDFRPWVQAQIEICCRHEGMIWFNKISWSIKWTFTCIKTKHFAKGIVSNILLRSHICRNFFIILQSSPRPWILTPTEKKKKNRSLKNGLVDTCRVQSANRVQYVFTCVVSQISLNQNQLKISASTDNQVVSVALSRSTMETEVQ